MGCILSSYHCYRYCCLCCCCRCPLEHETRKHSKQVNVVMWAFNPNRHTESVDICIFVCFICTLWPILMAGQTNEYNNVLELELTRNRWISVYICNRLLGGLGSLNELFDVCTVLFDIVQLVCICGWLLAKRFTTLASPNFKLKSSPAKLKTCTTIMFRRSEQIECPDAFVCDWKTKCKEGRNRSDKQ